MSIETLAVGRLEFKDGVSEERQKEIRDTVGDLLECELVWDEMWKEWKIEDLNWSSHIYDDRIEELKQYIETCRDAIREFEVDVYILDDPYWRVTLD